MSLTNFFSNWSIGRRLSETALQRWADSLAQRSLNGVWERTQHRAGAMRLAEARGYIRARAAQVVYDQVDAELQGRSASQAQYRSQLIQRATEAVISLTIRELVVRPAVHRVVAKAA